ncbi:hypothetical protein DY052_06295 [Apilactobacillus timberlakei]|nr:hypothetical protein DY052_06295 [Apilactobacillus timberlakei]
MLIINSKTNFGVIGKVHKKTQLLFKLMGIDVILILFTFIFIESTSSLFINASSIWFQVAFDVSFSLLVFYLRSNSLSNPGTTNIRLLFRDIRYSHNKYYQSINHYQDDSKGIKLNNSVKKMLDKQF